MESSLHSPAFRVVDAIDAQPLPPSCLHTVTTWDTPGASPSMTKRPEPSTAARRARGTRWSEGSLSTMLRDPRSEPFGRAIDESSGGSKKSLEGEFVLTRWSDLENEFSPSASLPTYSQCYEGQEFIT